METLFWLPFPNSHSSKYWIEWWQSSSKAQKATSSLRDKCDVMVMILSLSWALRILSTITRIGHSIHMESRTRERERQEGRERQVMACCQQGMNEDDLQVPTSELFLRGGNKHEGRKTRLKNAWKLGMLDSMRRTQRPRYNQPSKRIPYTGTYRETIRGSWSSRGEKEVVVVVVVVGFPNFGSSPGEVSKLGNSV